MLNFAGSGTGISEPIAPVLYCVFCDDILFGVFQTKALAHRAIIDAVGQAVVNDFYGCYSINDFTIFTTSLNEWGGVNAACDD